MRGMTEAQIQNTTTNIIYDETNESMPSQCHISLEEFRHGEELLQIRQCGHIFKPPELRRWFREHLNCPVCRCNVTETDVYAGTTPSIEHTEHNDTSETLQTANMYFREYGLYDSPDGEESDTLYQMEFIIRSP